MERRNFLQLLAGAPLAVNLSWPQPEALHRIPPDKRPGPTLSFNVRDNTGAPLDIGDPGIDFIVRRPDGVEDSFPVKNQKLGVYSVNIPTDFINDPGTYSFNMSVDNARVQDIVGGDFTLTEQQLTFHMHNA